MDMSDQSLSQAQTSNSLMTDTSGKSSESLESQQAEPSDPLLDEQDSDVDQQEWPTSYTKNSSEEEVLLAMGKNFRRQFVEVFPERKPLLLYPVNECGIQKFVSTTLRPTLLPYSELYDWQGCARFTSDFLSLELLDPPTNLPGHLRSPMWVLSNQSGTCFEYSTLLCSLLLGAGYNAYCVSGYAVKDMCLLDQTRQECPLLRPPDKDTSKKVEKVKLKKYMLRPLRDLTSKFEQRQLEKKQAEAEAALLIQQLEAQRLYQEQLQPPPDPLMGLRVHSWVLVLSGNRDVSEDFFIDPLTGLGFPTTGEQFHGIESVWNHENYWVNMQDCRNGCKEMTFNLDDLDQWECFLYGIRSKPIVLTEDDEEEMVTPLEIPKVFEMPPSWVTTVDVSQDDMDSRWPGGKNLIRYRNAAVENFAPYLMENGLVQRLTTYHDVKYTQPEMVTETYMNRNDHLEKRKLDKSTNTTTEHFRPFRSFGLKCHKYITLDPETMRQMDFYSQSRADGLICRVETPSEMTEHFEERSDFLYYRHTVFGKRIRKAGPGGLPKHVRSIQSVVEKFHRNRSKPACEDVAEREFLESENRIEVTYHPEDNKIIPSWIYFTKPTDKFSFSLEMVDCFQADRYKKLHTKLFLYETLMTLMKEEKSIMDRVRDSEQEVKTILATRKQEESTIQLLFSIYSRSKKAQTEEKKDQAKEKRVKKTERKLDVLTPYLVQIGEPENLTQQQANQLKQQCLEDFKKQQVKKANYLQSLLEKTEKELQDKIQSYEAKKLTLTKEEEEKVLNDCKNAMLRMKVLQIRLKYHEDKLKENLMALDKKIKQDPLFLCLKLFRC